jgi:hypothetical protein
LKHQNNQKILNALEDFHEDLKTDDGNTDNDGNGVIIED